MYTESYSSSVDLTRGCQTMLIKNGLLSLKCAQLGA